METVILLLYLGGNEQGTHEYLSKMLGKETLDTRSQRTKQKARNGSSSVNYQQAGRELMTLDEVRMLDNREALLFIRGELPVKDKKFDIMKHPNIKWTEDGGAAPYVHEPKPIDYRLRDLPYTVQSLDDIEILEDEVEDEKA